MTLPDPAVRTADVPAAWVEGVTFPDPAIDREPTWQERDILGWFDTYTPAFFEPLEIWHIAKLRDQFRRRVGRSPTTGSIVSAVMAGPRTAVRAPRRRGGTPASAALKWPVHS